MKPWGLFFLFTLSRIAAATDLFTDPAPPRVAILPVMTAPLARDNPDAIFHLAPKPLPPEAVTHDWNSFLGPNHNNVSTETKWIQEFPAGGPPLVWEMKKGESFAAPALSGGRLILFHRVGDEEVVDCLDAINGRRFWQFRYPTQYHDRYGYNHGPRCAPVIHGDWVYTFGAGGKLHCLKLQTGQLLWKRDLLTEFKVPQNFFGVGATPLVWKDRLIINLGAPAGPCVAAFDPLTGKLLWGAGTEWGPSYASPIPATIHGRDRVLVFAGGESRPATGGLLCIDPTNGTVDFKSPWRGTRDESVNASSPLVLGNRVLLSECYGSGGTLLDLQAEGSVKTLWTNPRFGTHFMTAVEKEGYLYGVDGHGPHDADFVCVEVATGHEIWRTQPTWQETIQSGKGTRDLTLGTYRCSLTLVDGRCLCLGEFGHLLWLDLSPKGYREISRTTLFLAPETWTPLVLSHGLLYVTQNNRSFSGTTSPRLLCYDLRRF
jgi:outer membrane protein assembly factor BamB